VRTRHHYGRREHLGLVMADEVFAHDGVAAVSAYEERCGMRAPVGEGSCRSTGRRVVPDTD
jgi:hypothetical protein